MGDSMAPRLLGPHSIARCQNCEANVVMQHSIEPGRGENGVCPACATRSIFVGVSQREGAPVDVVDDGQRPKRWSRVAFQAANVTVEPTASFFVKRLVGLPGETIEIHDGDLKVNGSWLQKSFAEFRLLAIPVADAHANHVARWQAWRPTEPARWSVDDEGLRFEIPTRSREDDDKGALQFFCAERSWLNDDYAFNWQVSRQLKPVRDGWLELIIDLETDASVTLEGNWRRPDVARDDSKMKAGRFRARIGGPARNVAISIGDEDFRPMTNLHSSTKIRVGLGRVDGRYLATLDDDVIAQRVAPPLPSGSAAFLKIVAEGQGRVRRARVLRDVHYLELYGAGHNGATLGDDECYLLGDNAPVSIDSRQLGPTPLARYLGSVVDRSEATMTESELSPSEISSAGEPQLEHANSEGANQGGTASE